MTQGETRTRVIAPSILLTSLIVASIGVATVGAALPDPTVRVEPAQLDLRPDDGFEVRVMIDDVDDLGGFEFDVAYDPSVVELKDATVGDFLGSTGRMTVPVGPQVSEEGGIMAYGALGIGDEAGPSGSGVLATITGTALKEGNSALRLEDVQVFSTAPEPLSVAVEDGEIIVNGGSAPPPESPDAPGRTTPWGWIMAAAVLVVAAAAALAFIVRRRRRRGGSAIDSG